MLSCVFFEAAVSGVTVLVGLLTILPVTGGLSPLKVGGNYPFLFPFPSLSLPSPPLPFPIIPAVKRPPLSRRVAAALVRVEVRWFLPRKIFEVSNGRRRVLEHIRLDNVSVISSLVCAENMFIFML
jgi:hypothetical protein